MSRNLLGNTVYLTKAEYDTLYSTGTVTLASGEVVTYSENDTYYVPESVASTTEDGLMSSSDKSKLDHISVYANQTQASSTNGNIIIDGVETTVYDDTDLRELASGKTGSYIIGTNASDDPGVFLSAGTKKLYKADGTEITSVSDFSTYVNGLTYLNTSTSHFKANTDSFSASGSTASSYLVFKPTQLIDGYTVVKNTEFASYFRPGDVFLVDTTEVPDRWFDGVSAFYKLETTKIDMSHVVYDNTVGNTISVKKTFSVFPEMSTETSPTNSKQLTTKYYTDNTFLKLSGGTMTGALNMSSQNLTFGSTDKKWVINQSGSISDTLSLTYDSIGVIVASHDNSRQTNGNLISLNSALAINLDGSRYQYGIHIYGDQDTKSLLTLSDADDDTDRSGTYRIKLFYPDSVGERVYLEGTSGAQTGVISEMKIKDTYLDASVDNATLNTYTSYVAPVRCELTDGEWNNLAETVYTTFHIAAPGMDSSDLVIDFNDSRNLLSRPLSSSASTSSDTTSSIFGYLDPIDIITNISGTDTRWYDFPRENPSETVAFDKRWLAIRNLNFSFRDLGRHSAQEITIHYSNGFNINNLTGKVATSYDAATGVFNIYDDDDNIIGTRNLSVDSLSGGELPENVPIYSTTFTKGNNDERLARVELETDDIKTSVISITADLPSGLASTYLAEDVTAFELNDTLDYSGFTGKFQFFFNPPTNFHGHMGQLTFENGQLISALKVGWGGDHWAYVDYGADMLQEIAGTTIYAVDNEMYPVDGGDGWGQRTSGSTSDEEQAAINFLLKNGTYLGKLFVDTSTIGSPSKASSTFDRTGTVTNGYRKFSHGSINLWVSDTLEPEGEDVFIDSNGSKSVGTVLEATFNTKAARINIYQIDFTFNDVIYTYKPLARKDKVEKLIYDKHTELAQNIDSVSSKLLDIEYKTAGNNQDIVVLESNQQEMKVMTFLDTLPTAKPKWADTLAYYNGVLYHCIPDPDVFGTGKVSGRSTYYIYDEHEGNTPSTGKINNVFGAEIVTNKTNIYEGRHSLLMGNSRSSGGNLELKENFTSGDSIFYIKCMKINVEPYVFKNTQNSSIIIRPCTINITENDETGTYSNSWSFEVDRPTTIEITPAAMQDYQLVISGSRNIADPENDGATIDSGDARFYIKGVTTIASDEEGQVENEYVWKELGGSGSGSGTSDYNLLTNKPQINGTTLNTGNTSLATLGIQSEINNNNKLPYSYLSGTPNVPTTYAGSSSAGGAADSVAQSLTFNSAGSGAASGTTFNGSTAKTISYNTVGAASSTHNHDTVYLKKSAVTYADGVLTIDVS